MPRCESVLALGVVALVAYSGTLVHRCRADGGDPLQVVGPLGGANGTVCGSSMVGAVDDGGVVRCMESCVGQRTQVWLYCVDGPAHEVTAVLLGEDGALLARAAGIALAVASVAGLAHTVLLRATGGVLVVVVSYAVIAAVCAAAWAVHTGLGPGPDGVWRQVVAVALGALAAALLCVAVALSDVMLHAARVVVEATTVACCAVGATVGGVLAVAVQGLTLLLAAGGSATCASLGLVVRGVPGSLALRHLRVVEPERVHDAGVVAAAGVLMAAFLGNIWRLALVRHAAAALAPASAGRTPGLRGGLAWAVSRGAGAAAAGAIVTVALAIVTAVTRYLYSRSTHLRYHARSSAAVGACLRCVQAALGALYLSFGVIYAGMATLDVGLFGAMGRTSRAARCHPMLFAVTVAQLSLVRTVHVAVCVGAAVGSAGLYIGHLSVVVAAAAGLLGLGAARVTGAAVEAAVLAALVRRAASLMQADALGGAEGGAKGGAEGAEAGA